MNEIKEIKQGGEIVSFVKGISKDISMMRINKDVDYLGCSTSYVYEKIQMAIQDLEWIAERIAETQGEVIKCSECGCIFQDLNKDNLCFRCFEEAGGDEEDF